MSRWFKWNMFVTSFLPLWISIVIISIWNIHDDSIINAVNYKSVWECMLSNITGVIIIGIILALVATSMVGINRFIKEQRKVECPPIGKIVRARKANKLTSEFLLAYILPMIAFDFGDLKFIVLFVVYFFTLAYLCIRNNNVYTNIYLEFKGFKIYDCDIEYTVTDVPKKYEDCIVISSRDLSSNIGLEIGFWDFEKYIYLDLHKKVR